MQLVACNLLWIYGQFFYSVYFFFGKGMLTASWNHAKKQREASLGKLCMLFT